MVVDYDELEKRCFIVQLSYLGRI